MKNNITTAIDNAMYRIRNGYKIKSESDFQSVIFGELYKELPNHTVKLEKTLNGDYQSYTENGKQLRKRIRKSRVDIYIEHEGSIVVIEVKFIQSAGSSVKADMIADVAKVERVIEAQEACEGYCIQLVKPNIYKKLPIGPVKLGHHQPKIPGWNYDFEIKGHYQINPLIKEDGHAIIIHHVCARKLLAPSTL